MLILGPLQSGTSLKKDEGLSTTRQGIYNFLKIPLQEDYTKKARKRKAVNADDRN